MKKTDPKILRQRAKTAVVAIQDAKLAIETADTTVHQQRLVVYKINRQLIEQGESPIECD